MLSDRSVSWTVTESHSILPSKRVLAPTHCCSANGVPMFPEVNVVRAMDRVHYCKSSESSIKASHVNRLMTKMMTTELKLLANVKG